MANLQKNLLVAAKSDLNNLTVTSSPQRVLKGFSSSLVTHTYTLTCDTEIAILHFHLKKKCKNTHY
jgi:hypothetical protein